MQDDEGPDSGGDASESGPDGPHATNLFGDCNVIGPGVQIVLDGRTITRIVEN